MINITRIVLMLLLTAFAIYQAVLLVRDIKDKKKNKAEEKAKECDEENFDMEE